MSDTSNVYGNAVERRRWLSIEVKSDFDRFPFHFAERILEARFPQFVLKRSFQRGAWIAHDEISNLLTINLGDERLNCETAAQSGAGITGQPLCRSIALRGSAHAVNTFGLYC
jgi:hypothetical protein